MKKNRAASKRGRSKQPAGESFELAVARIQQMLDPNANVTHNEILVDRINNRRQFDVVIRGMFAGRDMLGVIECKDRGRRAGPSDIEAFAKKCEHVNANLRLFVSRVGFTTQALRLAKHENVGCLSLFPSHPSLKGFSVGEMWYGTISRWTSIRLTVHFAQTPSPVHSFSPELVKVQGKPVIKWFLRELLTTHGDEKQDGEFALSLKFDEVRQLEIDGVTYPVNELTCSAVREHRTKKTWVSWAGDAVFDWNKESCTIPNNGQVVSSAFLSDVSEWEDYDGDISDVGFKTNFIRGIFHQGQKWNHDDDIDVPDLLTL